jgi:PAS domain S-box-containing protein
LKSENELLDSNNFKSQILDNIPALVYIKDAVNFRYLYANQAGKDFFGITQEELIGKNASEIFPEYYAEFLNRTDREAVLNDGKPGIYEEYVGLKEGNEQILITKKQLNKSKDGRPLNILCVSEVITDLKITDKKLKKSIQRFSKIFHINNVPILLFEFNSLIITDVNTSFCDLVGYGRQELIGLRFDKLQFFNEIDFKKDIFRKISVGDEIDNLEIKINDKNGNIKIILASFGRLELDGTETVIFTGLDISVRIEAEKEIKDAYQKQKQLAMMRSQFISMISHEFRTPLTTIMLSNDLLKRYGDLWDVKERNKHFQRIQDTILKMTQLMENVLIIGRMDSGQFVVNTEPLDIEAFCRSLANNIEFNTGGKYKIEIKINLALSIYNIDENLLALMLSNLLTNAVKYSSPKTNIIFEVSETDNDLLFNIIDFGIGIPDIEIDDLFNSFYRGSNVGSIAGYGLGLAIVKNCIDNYKGKITVKSKVNEGTEFNVVIPKFCRNSFKKKVSMIIL